jgi:hypothetical protein
MHSSDDVPEWLIAVAVVLVLLAFMVGATVGLRYAMDRPQCTARTQNIGLDSRWSFWGGCQVQIDTARWVPLDNWYYIEKK